MREPRIRMVSLCIVLPHCDLYVNSNSFCMIGLYWGTYNAVARRDGVYTSPTVGKSSLSFLIAFLAASLTITLLLI